MNPDSPSPVPPPLRRAARSFKIGPFVFVPEWSSTRGDRGVDPWAHRKGEPRMMTLGWTVFLLVAATGTLFATRSAGVPRPWQYHNGARWLLVLSAVGCCVLWPMVRLCQARPALSAARSVMSDLGGIALPLGAVMLPLPVLTGWSWPLMPAVWACVCGWALVLLSVAYWGVCPARGGEAGVARRAAAMAVVLALTVGTVLFAPMLDEAPVHRVWAVAVSPLAAVIHLCDPPSGMAARAGAGELRVMAGLWAAGVLMVAGLWVRGRGRPAR